MGSSVSGGATQVPTTDQPFLSLFTEQTLLLQQNTCITVDPPPIPGTGYEAYVPDAYRPSVE